MPRRQAEVVAETLNDALEDPLGKRLARIEADLNELEGDVKLPKWGNGVTLAGVLAVLVRLFLT